MADIANVLLSDQVPAVHTFVPISAQPDKAVWIENDSSLNVVEQNGLIIQFRRATTEKESSRVTFRLNRPVVQTIDGTATVVGVDRYIGEFIMAGAGTYQRRRDLLAMVRDLVAEALTASYVEDLEPVH